jgi:hypothetical protein
VKILRTLRPVLLLCFLAYAAATWGLATEAFGATELPPQLVAKLQTDLTSANTALAASRRKLAPAAAKQQHAASVAARAADTAELLAGMAKLVPLAVPSDVTDAVADRSVTAKRALATAQRELDEATEETAQAQAFALDADRRIRALRRASTTEPTNGSGGSWRFGSGGPAVSADTLDRYLASKGSPIAGHGAELLKAGVRHEIDPRLVVAIAGAESYFGITTCAPHNAWGWGCPSGPFSFSDWGDAIETVTAGLNEDYVDDGLTTVGEIHLRYAPPDAANDPDDLNYAWADNVARFLVEQGGDPQAVSGLRGPSA